MVLVEFGDYQCVACSRFFDHTEDALVRDYVETGKVRLVFRDFTIIGQDSANAGARKPLCQGAGDVLGVP